MITNLILKLRNYPEGTRFHQYGVEEYYYTVDYMLNPHDILELRARSIFLERREKAISQALREGKIKRELLRIRRGYLNTIQQELREIRILFGIDYQDLKENHQKIKPKVRLSRFFTEEAVAYMKEQAEREGKYIDEVKINLGDQIVVPYRDFVSKFYYE